MGSETWINYYRQLSITNRCSVLSIIIEKLIINRSVIDPIGGHPAGIPGSPVVDNWNRVCMNE
jgi:hypothetical protein